MTTKSTSRFLMPRKVSPGAGLIEFSSPLKLTYYSSNKTKDLLTEKEHDFSFSEFKDELSRVSTKEMITLPFVGVFFYELGELDTLETRISDMPEETPLAILATFSCIRYLPSRNHATASKGLQGPLMPEWGLEDYALAFNKVQRRLLAGDCYQLNLTYRNSGTYNESIDELCNVFLSQSTPAAYSHLFLCAELEKVIYSKSPECLFQVHGLGEDCSALKVHSMPIKGTAPLKDSSKFKEMWKLLTEDKKLKGELDMITDLVRNDLSKLGPPQTEVLSKALPLVVPGILHKYSRLVQRPMKHLDLYELLRTLFPGGSITGAPKTKVVELINKYELSKRGVYCGSTVVGHANSLSASINIRTAEVSSSDGTFSYGTGGGITLRSNVKEEFEETKIKSESFCRSFL